VSVSERSSFRKSWIRRGRGGGGLRSLSSSLKIVKPWGEIKAHENINKFRAAGKEDCKCEKGKTKRGEETDKIPEAFQRAVPLAELAQDFLETGEWQDSIEKKEIGRKREVELRGGILLGRLTSTCFCGLIFTREKFKKKKGGTKNGGGCGIDVGKIKAQAILQRYLSIRRLQLG